MGVWGRRCTYVTVYATILAEPIIFHLTSMEAMQQIFYGSGITQMFAAIVVTVVMVPLAQVLPIHLSASSTFHSVHPMFTSCPEGLAADLIWLRDHSDVCSSCGDSCNGPFGSGAAH